MFMLVEGRAQGGRTWRRYEEEEDRGVSRMCVDAFVGEFILLLCIAFFSHISLSLDTYIYTNSYVTYLPTYLPPSLLSHRPGVSYSNP